MKMGEIIRERRKKLGWTYRQTGDKLGISAAYLSDIEKGNRGLSQAMTDKINDVLRLSIRREVCQSCGGSGLTFTEK